MVVPSEQNPITVDLVVGSVGRLDSLTRLIGSLRAQTYRDFRLLIVEQRDPAAVEALIASEGRDLDCVVLRSAPGLSRARNTALRHVTADIVAFPDDDCWYRPDTLTKIVQAFADPSVSILIGTQVDQDGMKVLRTPDRVSLITRSNVWDVAMSSAIFARRAAANLIGDFDEQLGVGAGSPYMSGEETDWVLRGLEAAQSAVFRPDIIVHHPRESDNPGRLAPLVGLGYGRGMGRVMRTHRYGAFTICRAVARPAIGAVAALLAGNLELARFRRSTSLGRLEGYVTPE